MAKSSEKRPGPNAPCPCGSGKKFKRCCRDKKPVKKVPTNGEAAAASHAEPPPDAEQILNSLRGLGVDVDVGLLTDALLVAGSRDKKRMRDCASRLTDLFKTGGKLSHVRFTPGRFDDLVRTALPAAAKEKVKEPAALQRTLYRRTIDELCTPEFASRLAHELGGLAKSLGVAHDDRVAACVGLLAARLAESSGKISSRDAPTLRILFGIQLQEWTERSQAGQGPQSWERPPDPEKPAAPAMVGVLTDDADFDEQAAAERAMLHSAEAFDSATPPAVFLADEFFWILSFVRGPLEALERAGPRGRRLAPELQADLLRSLSRALDDDLLAGVRDRLAAIASEARAAPERRKLFGRLKLAFESDPVAFCLYALKGASRCVALREAEAPVVEAVLAHEELSPQALGAYGTFLAKAGHKVAADRVQRTIDRLATRPPSS